MDNYHSDKRDLLLRTLAYEYEYTYIHAFQGSVAWQESTVAYAGDLLLVAEQRSLQHAEGVYREW